MIGYGGFGTFLHHWWAKMDNIEVAAIAYLEHPPENAGGCRTYDDWQDLLADKDIDIVSIATPPGLHAEMACAAMRAGKHVVLEKPAAVTEEGLRQLLETQQETGMAVTVNHMIRCNPIIQHLRQIGQSGAFGRLRHATVNNYAQDESLPPGHWFWDEAQSGGIMVEHGVHFFDIINALGGEHPIKVCGLSHSRNASQRDRVAASVLYDQGLVASYYHAFSGPGFFEKTAITLAYDRARVEIQGWIPLQGTAEAITDPASRILLEGLPGWQSAKEEPIAGITDSSRPEGWGATELPVQDTAQPNQGKTVLSGTFQLQASKGDVYGASVQAILADLVRKIEDPAHAMAVTLEDAVEAVRTALLATS